MTHHDLIIKNGTIATASDVFRCDIAIKDGKIVGLGTNLGEATDTIDASGKLILPGGIDSHVHIAQPSGEGIVMADDFGKRHALGGLWRQHHRDALLHAGTGRAPAPDPGGLSCQSQGPVPYRCRLPSRDLGPPTDQVLGQDLPALIEDGYTSFKVFMTYEGLALDDREILEVMSVAARHRRARHGACRKTTTRSAF